MRAVTVIGVLLAAGAGTLRAQHAHQLEIGGFGSYSHYDKQFQLDNQFGGGGRLAFYFNDYLGLEVDGNVAYPFPKSGGRHTQVRYGSASLVINGGGSHNVLCFFAGYSPPDRGVNTPYNFALHAANGGLGERVFHTDLLAARLEARAYYAPKSCCLSSTWVGHVLGSAGPAFS